MILFQEKPTWAISGCKVTNFIPFHNVFSPYLKVNVAAEVRHTTYLTYFKPATGKKRRKYANCTNIRQSQKMEQQEFGVEDPAPWRCWSRRGLYRSAKEKNSVEEQDKTDLKRNANFSLEIHIFFSSQKSANRLRKNRASQKNIYSAGYQQNKNPLQNRTIWTWDLTPTEGKRMRNGQGCMESTQRGHYTLPHMKEMRPVGTECRLNGFPGNENKGDYASPLLILNGATVRGPPFCKSISPKTCSYLLILSCRA